MSSRSLADERILHLLQNVQPAQPFSVLPLGLALNRHEKEPQAQSQGAELALGGAHGDGQP